MIDLYIIAFLIFVISIGVQMWAMSTMSKKLWMSAGALTVFGWILLYAGSRL
jgi:hypothetical protein